MRNLYAAYGTIAVNTHWLAGEIAYWLTGIAAAACRFADMLDCMIHGGN